MPAAGRGARLRSSVFLAVSAVVLACAAGGCAGGGRDEARTDPPAPAPSAVDLSDAALWLSFEEEGLTFEGDTEYQDAAGGPFVGLVVTANDGAVEVVEGVGGRGDALGFPEQCAATTGCPRAMLEVAPDPALDPGTNDFEFGAAVWLNPDQTTKGSNIVQRGRYGTEGGLWKLQVDSTEGEPSCVVRSGDDQLIVRSSVSVADSTWHRVACRRDATGVEIDVDGVVDRVEGSTASVSNEWPVRIGSPGVSDQDDQFHGRVDDVYLTIGPPA